MLAISMCEEVLGSTSSTVKKKKKIKFVAQTEAIYSRISEASDKKNKNKKQKNVLKA